MLKRGQTAPSYYNDYINGQSIMPFSQALNSNLKSLNQVF